MAKRIVVVPYNEQWKTDFETIKQYLLTVVNDVIISIEHIGSTSVEGLSAKPIIDIDIVIKDYSVFDTVVERLATLGYIHEGNLGIKDREAFDYKGNVDLPKHHLYVCPEFSSELQKHIAFRDYLRNNLEAVKKYSKVKEEGAKLFPDSIDDYIAYKSPCIEEIYRKCSLAFNRLPKRKSNRLTGFDYSYCNSYFLTICTKNKQKLFGKVVGAPIGRPYCDLSEYGKIVDEAVNNIEKKYDRVRLDKYVIMPDHIHLLITILPAENGRPMGAPTISNMVNQLKGYVTKRIGFPIWQKLYYDHIIRDEEDFNTKWEYIDNNPISWFDKNKIDCEV